MVRYFSGNGYLILDTRNMTGISKAIEIKDALTSDIIYKISKPTQSLYDSSYYDYKIDSKYKINFIDAKNITGTIGAGSYHHNQDPYYRSGGNPKPAYLI